MLIPELFAFKNVELIDNKIVAQVAIKGAHRLFDGHFPANPITPGVIQLELVKELLNHTLKRNFTLRTMGRCKFLAIWNPSEIPEINIDLELSESDGDLMVSAVGSKAEVVFFKFSASYQ